MKINPILFAVITYVITIIISFCVAFIIKAIASFVNRGDKGEATPAADEEN